MGFGIRVPGVRISTRGVRVGPRFASVGVSSRGRVSGSVGPRIARVSASPRGVRVGTGLGPIGVSAGRGGIRVGGGVGPVFGSVGKGGVAAGIGIGPIWAATGLGGAKHMAKTSKETSSTRRMGMSAQYEKYRNEITKSGATRRSQDEMRIAGINAFLASTRYMSAPLQEFIVPAPMAFDTHELEIWARERAIQFLIDSGQLLERPTEIPEISTRETVVESVMQSLREQGISEPKHPYLQFGIQENRAPTRAELMKWCSLERQKSTSVFFQVLRRKAFNQSVSDLCRDFEGKIPILIDEWKIETAEFQKKLDALIKERIDKRNSIRLKIIAETDSSNKLIHDASMNIRTQQEEALKLVASVHKLYSAGDSTITTLVLQALMSDNEGSAAPIGLDDGDLLVVMTAPPASEVIWPEQIVQNTRISATKKSKADINTDYYMFLLSHAVASAREAIVASKKIENVRVLILDEKDEDQNFFDRRLVAVLNASRTQLEKLTDITLTQTWVKNCHRAVNQWQGALQSRNVDRILAEVDHFERSSILEVKNFLLKMVSVLEIFVNDFGSYIELTQNKRPRLIDLTDSSVNTSDEIQVTISNDVDSIKTLDVGVSMVKFPDFWILCGLIAEHWTDDEVDIDEFKMLASQICLPLYKPETLN
jgi:hypothetical protein